MRTAPRSLLCVATLALAACAAERAGGPTSRPTSRPMPAPVLDLAAIQPATLVVLDGVRLPPGSAARNRVIDADRVQSIEIFRGPVALARFGPDARAGAIVITTVR